MGRLEQLGGLFGVGPDDPHDHRHVAVLLGSRLDEPMGDFGATLGPWDIDAVRTVYEPGAGNPAPGVPANLVATATSASTILITWSTAENATGYQLEVSVNGNQFVQIATPTGTSFTDTGLAWPSRCFSRDARRTTTRAPSRCSAGRSVP